MTEEQEKSNYERAYEIAATSGLCYIKREDAAVVFAILAVVDELEEMRLLEERRDFHAT